MRKCIVLIGGIALVAVVIAAALLLKDGSASSEVNDHPTQNTIANQPDDPDTAADTEKDTRQIALILSSRDASATEMEEGAIATAEDAGYKILSYDAQSDAAQQLQFIEEAVAQGAEAILIDPVDADAAQSAVDVAFRKSKYVCMSMSRCVQSAVSPVCTLAAILGARSLPIDVAPNSTMLGSNSLIICTSAFVYGSVMYSSSLSSSTTTTSSAPYSSISCAWSCTFAPITTATTFSPRSAASNFASPSSS